MDGQNITDQMKEDCWTFYTFSRSSDPTIMIPYTRKLISHLLMENTLAGEPDNVGLLKDMKVKVSDAWRKYNDGYGGEAMIDCENILDNVVNLVYDKRFANVKQGSFKYPGR